MLVYRDIKSILTDFIEEVWNRGMVDACGKYIAPRYKIHHDPGDPWDTQELRVGRKVCSRGNETSATSV